MRRKCFSVSSQAEATQRSTMTRIAGVAAHPRRELPLPTTGAPWTGLTVDQHWIGEVTAEIQHGKIRHVRIPRDLQADEIRNNEQPGKHRRERECCIHCTLARYYRARRTGHGCAIRLGKALHEAIPTPENMATKIHAPVHARRGMYQQGRHMVHDPESHYWMARELSKLNEPERALNDLSRALDSGYRRIAPSPLRCDWPKAGLVARKERQHVYSHSILRTG
jgi:hypothetical protein